MHFGNEDKNILLFLERIIDTQDNELIIFVCNSARGEQPSEDALNAVEYEPLRKILSNTTEIVPDYNQLYKICFENYIMYQTGNESYASFDPNEERIGRGLILFEKSRLLDSLNKWSIAFDDGDYAFPGKFRHYGVYTLSHIIDIISHVEPTIERVNPNSNFST